jgi:hypothetical protein
MILFHYQDKLTNVLYFKINDEVLKKRKSYFYPSEPVSRCYYIGYNDPIHELLDDVFFNLHLFRFLENLWLNQK